ncbi:MAG: tRNA-dihydrouridine synthase [Patescibacteria group bacterium]|nr:tRNA-dihydrouridine synthase [Patescibacteria group bacterium]
MSDFWKQFHNDNPAYVLAPLAGISDSAFRQMCKQFGADILYSEMVSATALFYSGKKTIELMNFDCKEGVYIIQLFGNETEHFKVAIEFIIKNIKPAGIDINFGCPVTKVIKQGAGITLFQDLKQARAVIKATLEATDLPVSIKTRSQVEDVDVLKFLDNISDLDVSAIMIHGRAGNAGFSGPVDAKIIKKARNYFGGKIIANGGVYNRNDAQDLLNKSEADGVAIGQGAFGRPWIFEEIKIKNTKPKTKAFIFDIALKHAELAYKLKGEQGIIEMRKHLSWYVKGLTGAKKLRERLIRVNTLDNIREIFFDKQCFLR